MSAFPKGRRQQPLHVDTVEAVIAASGSVSPAVDCEDYQFVALHMPTGWDAASITYLSAPTLDGTYQDVIDDGGTEVTCVVDADQVIVHRAAHTNALRALRFVQIRSGTSATPVVQSAERTITLILKR